MSTLFHERVRAASNRLLWIGVGATALGAVALVFPAMATLVATLFVGWMLLLFGGLIFAAAFSIAGTGPFFGAVLAGLLSMASGIYFVFHPLLGEAALTLMLAALFVVQGAYELAFALEMRPLRGWGGMMFSAVVTILMAALIALGWPGVSLIALGVIVGINFITTGAGFIGAARALRTSARA